MTGYVKFVTKQKPSHDNDFIREFEHVCSGEFAKRYRLELLEGLLAGKYLEVKEIRDGKEIQLDYYNS